MLQSCSTRGGFPRIETLGFVSDGETCLLSAGGDIRWMCLPELDGPSVFSGLLGGAGHFTVRPTGKAASKERNVPRSLGIETEWRTPEGCLVVTDVLVTESSRPRQTLVRLVRCIEGRVEVEADLKPFFGYGLEPAIWDGAVALSRDGLELTVATDMDRLWTEGGRFVARRTLVKGEGAYISLVWGDFRPPQDFLEAEDQVGRTIRRWRRWLDGGRIPRQHPFKESIERDALVLKGLCHPGGGIAAAATTSLPETPGGVRNWDYRYIWWRDAAMIALALFRAGFREPADNLVRFAERVLGQQSDVQIMYGLRGEARLEEKTLGHLPGYEGAAPVRVGNGAYSQRQNDIWGQLLELIFQTQQDRMNARTWRLAAHLVEGALKAWGQPDRGIWEIRGVPRHFTMSKVYLWVALDRGSRLAALRGHHDLADEWERRGAEWKAEILQGVGEDGVFTAAAGDADLDAACLLIPTLGFLPGGDPRVRATVLRIMEGLVRCGLLLRYDTECYGDGLPGEEMAFAITNFWLVDALVHIGEPTLAKEWYEKMACHVGSLGLIAEEVDPWTGRHWGNTPQGFSHLGKMNAAFSLMEAGI